MAKFAGKIGFINQVEKEPGLFENETVERSYTGDILQDVRRWNNVEKVNDDLTLGNRFSIVADGYILDNMYTMKYMIWRGVRWSITKIELQTPRIIITVGGVYNGVVE